MIFVGTIFCFLQVVLSVAENFSCVGKVIGGYYADIASGCQMFHVCTLGEQGVINDIAFRCLEGTVFDQKTRVCERTEEVDCGESRNYYYLNNELYGPGIIPETAHDSLTIGHKGHQSRNYVSHIVSRTDSLQHIQFTDTSDWAVPTDMATSFKCSAQQTTGFHADHSFGCSIFHFCAATDDAGDNTMKSFRCVEPDHFFDEITSKCAPGKNGECGGTVKSPRKKELGAVLDTECLILGMRMKLADTNEACRKYSNCVSDAQNNIRLHSWQCPPQTMFSQTQQSCQPDDQVSCLGETYQVLKKISFLSHLLSTSQSRSTVLRKKRSAIFGNSNANQESQSGTGAGIFGEHASVIDIQAPGNTVEIHSQSQTQDKKATQSPSETKEETIIEVSEIASPDQTGKVTITSVVPKLVRQNGKNSRHADKPDKSQPVNISSAQSKVVVAAGSDADADIAKAEDTTTVPMDATTLPVETEHPSTDVPTTVSITTTTPAPTTKPTTAVTKPRLSTPAPDEIVETNFTCRDKELEKFYPDIEADCKVFHYCAPGFSEDQVLDLKFLCTGDTRFDSKTSKCQDMSQVTCELPKLMLKETKTPAPTTPSSSSSSPSTALPSTSTIITTSTEEQSTVPATAASTSASTSAKETQTTTETSSTMPTQDDTTHSAAETPSQISESDAKESEALKSLTETTTLLNEESTKQITEDFSTGDESSTNTVEEETKVVTEADKELESFESTTLSFTTLSDSTTEIVPGSDPASTTNAEESSDSEPLLVMEPTFA